MEERKRTIYAVLIALVVVLGLLYSFGMNLLSRTPELELPSLDEIGTQDPDPGIPGEEAGIVVQVEPNTVQDLIAQMSRYESYSRTVQVTYIWGDGASETVTSRVWVDGGWARTETQFQNGLTENSILHGDELWLWYPSEEGAQELFYSDSGSAGADLMQHLPTYEDVLALDSDKITAAGYMNYQGQLCIYVEVEQQELGYLYRYWISVNSGLLMFAETEKAGVIVYKMASNEVVSPVAAERGVFTLPDGTVLHQTD